MATTIKRIVDETISVFTTLIQEKLDVTNVTIVDQPEVNPNPVSPSMVKNVIIGAVAGIVISLDRKYGRSIKKC